MHLDVLTKKTKDTHDSPFFISHLHNDRLRLVSKNRVRLRNSKKYSQLFMMITPFDLIEIPEEIVEHITVFHDNIRNLDLQQDRDKTIRLIKFTIRELNITIRTWNEDHSSLPTVKMNLTIVFVYGDRLVMLNFGRNHFYLYRDGDLSQFKGSRLDTEKHYSVKTGREGKLEYMMFDKIVPPIGDIDFGTDQINTLFTLTHRLLKDDILTVLSDKSILVDKFRVNVNLYEHAIEKTQMIQLIKKSLDESSANYAIALMTFDEVREFRQTVRYTLFRTPKGLMSFLLLLATLLSPLFYQQNLIIDSTPVFKFDTPPTTAHITLVLSDDEFTLDLIPTISGSPESDIAETKPSISELFSRVIAEENYQTLASYFPIIVESGLSYDEISSKYYGHITYSDLIKTLNPGYRSSDDTYKAKISKEAIKIFLPVFNIPYQEDQSLSDLSNLHYGSENHTSYLRDVNSLKSYKIPFKKTILIPPLEIYPIAK